MHRLWESIVRPLLYKLNPTDIVEVGAEKGLNTVEILKFCDEKNAHLTTIDPFPLFDVDELKKKYDGKFDFQYELSLDVLPSIKDYDLILLDGDHNWYTIFNELKSIEKNFNQDNFPFIIFHDIHWPYGRRDLYYNPDNIPKEFLNEYDEKGMFPGVEELLETGGLNSHLKNALHENTPKNGVLTGIEDFLNESELNLTFRVLNAFHGLGMLYRPNPEIDQIIDEIIIDSNITGILEEHYLKDIITSHDRISQQNKDINTKARTINELNQKISKKDSEIKNLNRLVKERNHEILSKDKNIALKNDKIQKLKKERKKLRRKNKQMLSSNSWKITKPLRKSVGLIKNIFNKSPKRNKTTNESTFKGNWVSRNQSHKIINKLNKKVSIIVPIYNAYEDTKRCINSVLDITEGKYELILIDDNSPDERIGPLLDTFEDMDNVKIIRNSENKGFVQNVNMGIKNSEHDVILLNSDTIVTPRWLQKLISAAYMRDEIGTVTPVANNSGVFSVPKINVDNPIPEELGINGMAGLVEKCSKRIFMEAPTGNGFCMYIKRDTIESVGLFDYKSFGRGYGEENDFCMRAIRNGWVNIIDDTTYIYHKGSSSFSEAKEQLIKEHMKILGEKHPTYHQDVQKFIHSEELKEITTNVEQSLSDYQNSEYSKKNLLFVLHGGFGGTPLMTQDLIKSISNEYNCYLLISTGKKMSFYQYDNNDFTEIKEWKLRNRWYAELIHDKQYSEIYYNILKNYSIDLVHIMHLIHHTFDLPIISHRLGLKVVISFHDFYYICPSYNLINEHGDFCCAKCNDDIKCHTPMSLSTYENINYYIDIWRKEIKKLFSNVDEFMTTYDFIKDLFLEVYPFMDPDSIKLIEHGNNYSLKYQNSYTVPSQDKPIKILFLGNINVQKGSEIIKKLNEIDEDSRLEFHFLGATDENLEDMGIHHGKYKRDDLVKHIEDIRPSFIGLFSIWPEIYCYTLSEAWAFGIPVLGSNLGAIGKRISESEGGWLIDLEDLNKTYDFILDISSNNEEYLSKLENIKKISFKTIDEMSLKYKDSYNELLD